jgi:predicted esterase YcpF (UPF0227 family)
MNPLLQKANNYPKTILLNPLLSLDQLINIEILPLEVLKYVREIDSFSDCLIIISDNDEVLNHGKISAQIIKSNQIIVSKNDSHKLLKFKDYFEEINRYSNS